MARIIRIFILCLICCIISLHNANAANDDIFTLAESNAFAQASSGHYIKARQLAEEILKEDPNSLGALYTMTYVFWEGEGNLNRAMQYMKKTLIRFEELYCQDKPIPNNGTLQSYHQRMLRDLAAIYAELDQRQEELDIHQRISDLYNTPLSENAVWPLLKLNRFEEAEAIANDTIQRRDRFFSSQAYNDLTAINDAKHKHLDAFHASERSVEFAAGTSCVILLNHARSYSVFLNIPKAIEFYLKAAEPHDRDCVSDPFTSLSEVYLIDAAWQRSISAILKVRKKHTDKRFTIQVEKAERTVIAEVLYEMGFAERALPLMKTVVDAPGRLGYDSLLKEQVDMANEVLYYAMSKDAIQRIDEKVSAITTAHTFWVFDSDARSQVKDLLKQKNDIARKQWSTHQKTFKSALNPQNLKSFLVPFYVLSPSYFWAVIDMFGRKTVEFLIDYQEKSLEPEEIKAMKPAYDLMKGYIAWKSDEPSKALEYLDAFDKKEQTKLTLLDNQAKLIRADILYQQNDISKAWSLMSDVYQSSPTIFRHFSIPLPISLDNNSSWDSNDLTVVKKVLSNASMFKISNDAPFVVSAQKTQNSTQICLSSKLGRKFTCSSTDPKDYSIDPDKEIPIAETIDNFFHVAFTPGVDISQSDLHSLDGSAIQISADQALEKLIGISPNLNDSPIPAINNDD